MAAARGRTSTVRAILNRCVSAMPPTDGWRAHRELYTAARTAARPGPRSCRWRAARPVSADGPASSALGHRGATWKSTGAIAGAWETFDAAFVSTSVGWVLTVNGSDNVIAVTTDGGYHWSKQLAVPRNPAG